MILINTHHLTCIVCIHVLCATEVAEEVFNRCTFTNATKDGQIRPDSKDYRVIFNYEFLEDFQDPKSKLARAFTRRYVHAGFRCTAIVLAIKDLLPGNSKEDGSLVPRPLPDFISQLIVENLSCS